MKKIKVKRYHKQTGEELTLYHGNAIVNTREQYASISYIDEEKHKVKLELLSEKVVLSREGSTIKSRLEFELLKTTKSEYVSAYGSIYLNIFTQNIVIDDRVISIEYRVDDSADQDVFKIDFIMEE